MKYFLLWAILLFPKLLMGQVDSSFVAFALKIDSLNNLVSTYQRTIDSLSRENDPIYLSLRTALPVKHFDITFEELFDAKKQFDGQFADYIKLDNFPKIFPLEPKEIKKIIGFGKLFHPIQKTKYFHRGIDMEAVQGSKIKSTISGTVIVQRQTISGFGNYVVIKSKENIQILFAHLQDIFVSSGDKVVIGQVIGTVGNSGLSVGYHLHYEIRIKNKPISPIFAVFDSIDKGYLKQIFMRHYESMD